MEIKYCKACQKNWCFRGAGRPVRCGQCKSPYWDREKGVRKRPPYSKQPAPEDFEEDKPIYYRDEYSQE